MLKPRVEHKDEKTFGPCAFEPDQRLVSEDLCKVRSGGKNWRTCGSCVSPFRFCKRCLANGARRLVALPADGSGLCPKCAVPAELPTKGAAIAPPVVAAAPRKSAHLSGNAFDGIVATVVPATRAVSKPAEDAGQHQQADQRVRVTPTRETSRPLLDDAKAAELAARWKPIVELYHASYSDTTLPSPGLFELSDAVAAMKEANMGSRAIIDLFTRKENRVDVTWVTRVYGIRRLIPELRVLLEPNLPDGQRLGLQRAYAVSMRSEVEQQRFLATKAARLAPAKEPEPQDLENLLALGQRYKLSRDRPSPRDAPSLRELSRGIAQAKRQGVRIATIVAAFGENYNWILPLSKLDKITDVAWTFIERNGAGAVSDRWPIARLQSLASIAPQAQLDRVTAMQDEALGRFVSELSHRIKRLGALATAISTVVNDAQQFGLTLKDASVIAEFRQSIKNVSDDLESISRKLDDST